MGSAGNSAKSVPAIVMEDSRPLSELQQKHDRMGRYQASGPLIKSRITAIFTRDWSFNSFPVLSSIQSFATPL